MALDEVFNRVFSWRGRFLSYFLSFSRPELTNANQEGVVVDIAGLEEFRVVPQLLRHQVVVRFSEVDLHLLLDPVTVFHRNSSWRFFSILAAARASLC